MNHGHSANSPRDADEPDRADELEGFLAALGIQRPILAGNSMGGNTALRWAARHPGDAVALIISGAGVRAAAESMPATPKPLDPERLYIPFGDSFTPQFEAQQPDMHARYYRIRSTATRIEALRHPRKASAKTVAERAGMVDAVKKITSPLQIITGDLDTALEAAKGLHAVRPDVGYVQMPGAPHNAYWEMAKEWNAVAAAFLDSVMAAVPAR